MKLIRNLFLSISVFALSFGVPYSLFAMTATPDSYSSLDDNITLTKTLGGVIFCTYDDSTGLQTNANNADRDLPMSAMVTTLGDTAIIVEASSDPGCNGLDLAGARADGSYLGEASVIFAGSPPEPTATSTGLTATTTCVTVDYTQTCVAPYDTAPVLFYGVACFFFGFCSMAWYFKKNI